MKENTPWWRFVVAVISFVLAIAFLPLIIYLLRELVNLIFPSMYFSGIGLLIYARCYGMYLSINIEDLILNEKHPMFVVVSSVVAGIYLVSVSSFNLAIGVVTFWEFVSFLGASITAFVIAFKWKDKIPTKG